MATKKKPQKTAPLVGIIMGSQSDWSTLKAAADMLDELGVAYESKIVSAHRTPQRLYEYATGAASRGLKIIIAAIILIVAHFAAKAVKWSIAKAVDRINACVELRATQEGDFHRWLADQAK